MKRTHLSTWRMIFTYFNCVLHKHIHNCNYFFELEDFIMINRQTHYTKYLHDKLETKDIRCI